MYLAGLSAAMQYVAVEQTTIDRVISFLRENSDDDWARQFASDAPIAMPSLGRGDRAQELGLHHDRAQQVMAETVQGIVRDLEAFADSVNEAARLIRRADEDSAETMVATQRVVEMLDEASLTSHSEAAYDRARNERDGDA